MTTYSRHDDILADIVHGDFHKETAVVGQDGRVKYSDHNWGSVCHVLGKASIVDADDESDRNTSVREPDIEDNLGVFTNEFVGSNVFNCDSCVIVSCGFDHIDVGEKVQGFLTKLVSPKPALKPAWDEKVMAPEALVKMYEETALMVSQRSEEDTIKIGLKLVGAIYKWAKNTEFEEQGTDLSKRILVYFKWILWRETEVMSITANASQNLLFPQVLRLMKAYMFYLRGFFFKPRCRKHCDNVHRRVSNAIWSRGKELTNVLNSAQARIMRGSGNAIDKTIPPAPQPSLTLMCPSFQQHVKAQLPQLAENIRHNNAMDIRIPDFAALVAVLPYLRDIRTMELPMANRKRARDGEPKERGQDSIELPAFDIVSPRPAETDLSKLQNLDPKGLQRIIYADEARAYSVIDLAVRTPFGSVEVIVPLLHVILLSLCRHAAWKDAATIAELLVLSLREAIEASTSTSPSTVLLKSLALALGASAVVLRKSGRASSGAIAAKEADETFEQGYSNGKFGRDLLVWALLKVEHGCCLNNSSDASAIVEAIAVADDAVKGSRQAVSNGNLAPQGRPILARALVMQGRALVKGNRVADAQVSFEEGIALYRNLVVKCRGQYEVQLAEALCRAADTYREQDPAKHYQCLRQARELYEGQRLRWASFRLQAYHRAVGTFKNEIASLTLALQNSQKVAIEYLRKACRLAFIDFEGAAKFAKVSEILNLVDVTSAKDVRPTQVHYLAAALYISGYSNLMLKRAQAAANDLYPAFKIYRRTPPLVHGDGGYASVDLRTCAWTGVAYCALGEQYRGHHLVSQAIRDIRDRPSYYIRSKEYEAVNQMVRDAGSSDLSKLLVALAGVQVRGRRFREAEESVKEALELMEQHSAEGRSINADYKKTAWSLKALILEANRRSEGLAEALGEAEKVEGRDFSYVFTFTESEEEVPVSPS